MNRLFFAVVVLVALVGCGSIKREYKTPADLNAQVDAAIPVEPFEVATAEEPLAIKPVVVAWRETSLHAAQQGPTAPPELFRQAKALHQQLGESEIALDPNTGRDQLQRQINRLLAQIAERQDKGWEQHLVQKGETLSGILAERGVSSKIASVIGRNTLENPNRIFAGQNLWLPAREKPEVPEVVPVVEETVGASEVVQAPSLGDVLVNTYSPRIRAERRTKVENEVTVGGKKYDLSLEEAYSLPENIELETQYGPVVFPLRAEAIAFVEAREGVSRMDGPSGWTDGSMYHRSPPSEAELREALRRNTEAAEATWEAAARLEREVTKLGEEVALLRSERDGARSALVDTRARLSALVVISMVAIIATFLLTFWLSRRKPLERIEELEDDLNEVEEDWEKLQKRVSLLERAKGTAEETVRLLDVADERDRIVSRVQAASDDAVEDAKHNTPAN